MSRILLGISLGMNQKQKNYFFSDIQHFIQNGNDFVIESNFIGKDKDRLSKVLPADAEVVEVHCYARGLSSFIRAVKRNETKERHPGHHDRRWYPKILFQSSMHSIGINIGAHNSVALSHKIKNVDTTDLEAIDFDQILGFVSS